MKEELVRCGYFQNGNNHCVCLDGSHRNNHNFLKMFLSGTQGKNRNILGPAWDTFENATSKFFLRLSRIQE